MTWELSLAGLLIGTLVGLTGMGGGSLMTPLLVLAFGFNPTVAIGTDILHGAVFKTVGALRHRSLGTVHLRLSGWMFLASAPMSLVGVAMATWIRDRYGDGADSAMTAILGAAFLAGGLGLVAKSFIGHTERPDAPFGNVNLGAVGWLLIGSIPGVLIGSQFTVRVPDRSLRIALATVLALSGIKLLEPPGDVVILALVAATGVALLVLVQVRRPGGRMAPAGQRS